ncbi:MAG: alanine/ornithine racemase family PLP-dependent enzyme [Marinobacter sp.]|uniref:alanine/ornithine racemase family PLP-dependent enzyme n=1 Tax=Marinobacter sp. TaxID=50741 RepID=UPI00396E2E8C
MLWNETKLRENIRFLKRSCDSQTWPVIWVPVTKATCAHPDIVRVLLDEGISEIADSRVDNLKTIKALLPRCKTLLLRLPGWHEIKDVIKYVDTSLISEQETLSRLQAEAKAVGVIHQVILMVELGDLREGVLPEHILDFGRFILEQDHIDWCGIGTNLTCYGGILPTPEKMRDLLILRDKIMGELGHRLSIVSGGNSSSLPLLLDGDMPEGINHLRLGEALFLGKETAKGQPVAGMHCDVFTLEAEVIEVKIKNSVPQGLSGMDAFGKVQEFDDLGRHTRAIAAIGRQDVPVEELTPEDETITILGGSSDHLILDVANDAVQLGDIVGFRLNYAALLQAMTSPYVAKVRATAASL